MAASPASSERGGDLLAEGRAVALRGAGERPRWTAASVVPSSAAIVGVRAGVGAAGQDGPEPLERARLGPLAA